MGGSITGSFSELRFVVLVVNRPAVGVAESRGPPPACEQEGNDSRTVTPSIQWNSLSARAVNDLRRKLVIVLRSVAAFDQKLRAVGPLHELADAAHDSTSYGAHRRVR